MNTPFREPQFADQESESVLSALLKPYSEDHVFDAIELMSQHSSIRARSSLMVDLAYEDYWRKLRNGCNVDTAEFAGKFPEIRDRLLNAIDAGSMIRQAPQAFLGLIPPKWPKLGSELGPFTLTAPIGSGAFSRVYLARDRSLAGRAVTLKVTQQAVREAEALGRLQHPSIVSPLGLYDQILPGLQVIAMPFCGQATLADLVQFNRVQFPTRYRDSYEFFDFQEFLSEVNAEFQEFLEANQTIQRQPFVHTMAGIGAQVAAGLVYAHSKGFLHCDIKPSNILLKQNGEPVILDFNLSIDTQQDFCAGGTRTYIAPEQLHAMGKSVALTGAVDVYSLGATLIELLQGTPPFGNISSRSTEKERCQHPLERLESPFRFDAPTRREIGSSLADLLESCVTFDPAHRPTAKVLAQKLHEFSQVGQQTRKISPKHRRYAMTACIGGALLLTSGTAWTIASAPTPNERFELGITALTDGHSPKAAQRQFTRILNAEPDRLDARMLRICAAIQLKDWNAAFGELKEFRGIETSPEKHALAGYILCQWNQQNEIAEFEYERALDAGLERADTLNNLAYCQIRVNKLNAAVETLAQAKRLAPESPEILLNEACVELKLCRELKTLPRLNFAEAIVNHKGLANDREALLVAATIYWQGARQDLALSEKAFECLARAVPHGLTTDDLDSLPASKTLKSAPKYQQIAQQAAGNRRSKRSEVTVARLIPPPIENRDYLNHLVAPLAKENQAIVALTHNMTSTGNSR